MLSLKLFEKCFPFNRVLSFLVSENLTSFRLNKYFSTPWKKVVSDSPGLVYFANRLVISVLNLPDGQMKVLGGIQITEEL